MIIRKSLQDARNKIRGCEYLQENHKSNQTQMKVMWCAVTISTLMHIRLLK